MSDRLRPLGFEALARWVLGGLRRGEVLELPQELWHEPFARDALGAIDPFTGRPMAAPFGVAAGPHTQLATGIVASWLCGARLLELKTVQQRAVEVARPCIRIRDEGLNTEWSQELEPAASYEQYLDAWVLIHALHRLLEWPGTTPETVFDLSVGYDLEGLLSPPMQDYLARAADAGELLEQRLEILARLDPRLEGLEVPSRLAASATISTLHGCPPEEIGGMARHLMEEHGLHVRVKLNPTLLGAAAVREVLHEDLGWRELIPDEKAFAHDLDLEKAVDLIAQMQEAASRTGVHFGVKLSNTLPLVHEGTVFSASERTMYLSGRPLHALTVQTAARLDAATGGGLSISFCGGADAFNLAPLAAAGLLPVTVCSDLLRPGGVGRLSQYGTVLREALAASGADSLESFAFAWAQRAGASDVGGGDGSQGGDGTGAAHRSRETGGDPLRTAARHNLQRYAEEVLGDARYRRETGPPTRGLKGSRPLGLFDCIHAPCVEDCGIDQDVPEYMRRVGAGDFTGAAAVIRQDNAMGASLGRACHHPCETRCTREAYETPLAIRHIKRFALEAGETVAVEPGPAPSTSGPASAKAAGSSADEATSAGAPQGRPAGTAPGAVAAKLPPVAIVGAGPCGLAAALDLRRAGVPVIVLEAREQGAGMVTETIPSYRAPEVAAERDLQFLRSEGVEFRFGLRFGRDIDLPALREEGFQAVVLAVGAARGRRLGIPGEDCEGVMDGLEFLRRARQSEPVPTGAVMAVVGGGDVAVDCARTLRRLAPEGQVEILYRRRVEDMPAAAEELRALREEGIDIRELLVPVEALAEAARNDTAQKEKNARGARKLARVRCARLRPGAPGPDGRPRPEATGETVELEVDLLVTAIGQEPDEESLAVDGLHRTTGGWVEADAETGRTSVEGVWAGGDARSGPSTLVAAAGDGRRIAADILAHLGRVSERSKNLEMRGEEASTKKVEIAPAAKIAAVAITSRAEIPIGTGTNGAAPYRRLMEARARRVPQVPVPELPVSGRRDFTEVLGSYTQEQARREAARCLECDLLCSTCVTVCPNRAFLTLEIEPFTVRWAAEARPAATEERPVRPASSVAEFTLSQPFQTVVLNDLCNACGNCTEFCPTAGKPFEDKPRLTLDPQVLEILDHNVVLLQRGSEGPVLRLRWHGQEHRMEWGETVRYEGPRLRARLDPLSGEMVEAPVDLRPSPAAGNAGAEGETSVTGNDTAEHDAAAGGVGAAGDAGGARNATAVGHDDWEPCFLLFVLARGLVGSREELVEGSERRLLDQST